MTTSTTNLDEMMATTARSQEQSRQVLEKLMAVARAESVFGAPVTVGDRVVITASEVMTGMGFGFGMGSGTGPAERRAGEAADQSGTTPSGAGGGGGGGGFASGRPVAIISVGPEGVKMQPIVDVTKVGLAFLAAFGAMAMLWARMMRVGRR